MTLEKKNKTAKGKGPVATELSKTRKRAQGKQKYRSTRQSEGAVDAFFNALNSRTGSLHGYTMAVVEKPVGGGRFQVKDNYGERHTLKVKAAMFLKGRLHHNPLVATSIHAGSFVVVKDDEIVGIMGLEDAARAKRHLGWNTKNANEEFGFNWNVANEHTRKISRGSRSRSRSRSRGKGKKLSAVSENGEGNSKGKAGSYNV